MRPLSEMPERPFEIGSSQTRVLVDPSPWAKRFAQERAIVCRDIFEPSLLARLCTAARGTSYRKEHIGEGDHVTYVGTREVEDPQRVGGMLNLLLQRSSLYRWLEQVTGHAGLAGTEGRLMQARASAGDALDWHDDLNHAARALAITISFADAPFSGGAFELRQVGNTASARYFQHDRAGTALIFDIGPDLEHRVLPVDSGGPRRVFGGWILREKVVLAA